MRVVCVGAGPGGLYTALLLKRGHPDWDVAVFDQNGPDETFGFGVVFSEPTLERLRTGDPTMHAALLRIAKKWDPIEVRLRGEMLRCSGQGFVATGRHALLSMLRDEAKAAGVALGYHTRIDPENLPEADILVASDGAGSAIRRRFGPQFEPTIETGSSKYIWFGTAQRFECLTFIFEKSEHGAFGVHAYPYSDDRSTFIVETQRDTVERAGLATGDQAKDERASVAYCERLFAKHLDGHSLLTNQSRWASFRTVRNASWRSGRIVLLGDAAHTAHFSMGSGTKMALEDALGFSDAFAAKSNVDEALALYETTRRADVRKVQQASRPSLFWWESFQHLMRRPLEPFMFHFLTRNMRVTRDSLLRRDRAFGRRIEEWHEREYGGDASKGARGLPLVVRDLRLANRIVSEGNAAPDAALVVSTPEEFAAASASGASGESARGVRIAATDVATFDFEAWRERAAWLEIVAAPRVSSLRAIENARRAWARPLSVSVDPRGCIVDDVVSFAVQASRAGADVITLAWRGKEQPDIVACVEAIRFGSRVLLAVDPAAANVDGDTVVLSGRADLCYVRPPPPA